MSAASARRRNQAIHKATSKPLFPTTVRTRLPGGRIGGTDGSLWCYRSVPMAPVVDAATASDVLAAAGPLMALCEQLAQETRVRAPANRRMNRGAYRELHLLLVNVPATFSPPRDHPLAGYLHEGFSTAQTYRRVLLVGVRLRPRVAEAGLLSRQGLTQAIDSVSQTIRYGGAPLSDFDEDYLAVDRAMTASGMQVPSGADLSLANSWWNGGRNPEAPLLVHADHLHVFGAISSAKAAARLVADGDSECLSWPELPQHHSLSFGCLYELELRYVPAESPLAQWVPALLAEGAVAVSIRAKVEPPKVTREELRRRRKQYRDDINERASQGKMERAEQEELYADLDAVESIYATQGPPTLVDCGVLAAFSGHDDRFGYSLDQIGRSSGLSVVNMVARQEQALAECWLASPVRATPHLHDFPIQTVAASGLPSLSVVGDREGALVGFTERDRQPSYLSPVAASKGDGLPLCVVPGATGSGKSLMAMFLADQFARLPNGLGEKTPVVMIDPKALALDTPIPIPDGWSTIGEIKAGDIVFARDGTSCHVVALSPVFLQPDLFEIALDDGQKIRADADHRWVVRMVEDQRRSKYRSTARWRAAQDRLTDLTTRLQDIVDRFAASDALPISRLYGEVCAVRCDEWSSESALRRVLRCEGVPPTDSTIRPALFPVKVAVKALIAALDRQRWDMAPEYRVMTTRELLESGVRFNHGVQARFAIPVSEPVDGEERDLPIDPYLLGAWLGDGTSKSLDIVSGAEDADAMYANLKMGWPSLQRRVGPRGLTFFAAVKPDSGRCMYGHADYVTRTSGRRKQTLCRTCARSYQAQWRSGKQPNLGKKVNTSLGYLLNDLGVLHNKHIPSMYLRASIDQRLSLLQGLMDTDGTVKRSGSCRFVVTNQRLHEGVLELVRSLGIKATPWTGRAVITERTDGERRRVDKGAAYYINFRTALPVFRLKRKLERLPSTLTDQARHLAIRSIEPVPSAAARCISVDSRDHTYLAAGFVPTHNSGSDFTAAVERSGGRVASLDDLLSADGVYDPMRFSITVDTGVELAASMLMSINPWGTAAFDYETPLVKALSYGARAGADCIGVALQVALRDGQVRPQEREMVERVLDLASSSPMFRACVGMEQGGPRLRASEGITLVMVGSSHLDLPEPGAVDPTLPQRIALALVRMMVFGSAMALNKRRGVIMLDEGWVFLSAGKTEVERLGRLARSQQVLPIFLTQRVTDALNAGLAGYISRGIILPLRDEREAVAACELFKLEPTPERIGRITANAAIGATTATEVGAPNWGSMRALRDPRTRKVLRGTVGIYCDLEDRAVPVEIRIPEEFLAAASTNPGRW